MNIQTTLLIQEIIAKEVKKKFTNLTVGETLSFSNDLLIKIMEVLDKTERKE